MAHNFQQNFNNMLRPPMLQIDQQQQLAQFPSSAPINASMPWCIENMPWAQPVNLGIMHFQAPTNFMDENTKRALLHAKRKSNPNPAIAPPPKQFITEEKITAHFNGLHISNNFTQNENSASSSLMEDDGAMGSSAEGSTCFANYQDYRITAKELEEKLRNANRITLCEEFKKLQDEQKKTTLSTIIPEALINHIEKPCTALVLWQPPPILELLHRKNDEDLKKVNEKNPSVDVNKANDIIEDIEFAETDDVDAFIDNNNTCTIDYNKFNADMDEDL